MRHRHSHAHDTDLSAEMFRKTVDQRVRMVGAAVRGYDIPYLAGISVDGQTVYIDRHMPDHLVINGVSYPTDRYLIWHETEEWELINADRNRINAHFGLCQRMGQTGAYQYSADERDDDLAWLYQINHQEAQQSERDAVINEIGDWDEYNRQMDGWVKVAEAEKIQKCPPDLLLVPYEDEEDWETLWAIAAAGGPVSDLIRSKWEAANS